MRSAANSEAMTKCNAIATSACLQNQRQWLSAMPLQPLLLPITVAMNECNVTATCDDSQTQRQSLSAMSLLPLQSKRLVGSSLQKKEDWREEKMKVTGEMGRRRETEKEER